MYNPVDVRSTSIRIATPLRPKVPTSPRKPPKQQRSRATVEAFLAATARVLVREGYEKASTNRVAEVSGYGIGSLYEYFPNKESLVATFCRGMYVIRGCPINSGLSAACNPRPRSEPCGKPAPPSGRR